jgi:hypothetical protein
MRQPLRNLWEALMRPLMVKYVFNTDFWDQHFDPFLELFVVILSFHLI